jgi:hypothetical protein
MHSVGIMLSFYVLQKVVHIITMALERVRLRRVMLITQMQDLRLLAVCLCWPSDLHRDTDMAARGYGGNLGTNRRNPYRGILFSV